MQPIRFALLRWMLQCVLTRARSYRSRLGRKMTLFSQRVAVGSVMLAGSSVLACPACGAASEQTSGAYIVMTVIMSLLPLTAIGGLVYWISRQLRGQ